METSRKLKIAITGTTSGIGRATSDLLMSKHEVWCINRPEYDLLDDDALNRIDLSGYDVLINNAGADYGRQQFLDHDYEQWQQTVKINYIVPAYLTQKFMQQNTQGTIINVSSTGNLKTATNNSTVFYRGSKQALKHFTHELSSFDPDFKVIDVEPGKTNTNFTQNAGQGIDYNSVAMSPMEVAKAIETAIVTPNITHIRVKSS